MRDAFVQYGAALIERGYLITPTIGKRPYLNGWQDQKIDLPQFEQLKANGAANANVGVICGQGEVPIHLVDIDVLDPDVAKAMQRWVDENIGCGIERVGMAPKIGLIFRGTGFKKVTSKSFIDKQGRRHRLEVLGYGQQFILAGIHPDTGRPYEHGDFLGNQLWGIDPGELPPIDVQQAMAICAEFERLAAEKVASGEWVPESGTGRKPAANAVVDPGDIWIPDPPVADLTDAQIEEVCSWWDVEDYNSWIQLGQALHHQFEGGDDGLMLWDRLSQKSVKYPDTGLDALSEKWAGFGQDVNRREITLRTMIAHANRQRPPAQAVAAPEVAAEAEDVWTDAEWLIDLCSSPVELLGAVAARVGEMIKGHAPLKPVAQNKIRQRFRELVPGGRLTADQLRNALDPQPARGGRNARDAWIVDPSNPRLVASEYLSREHTWSVDGMTPKLAHHAGEWYRWDGHKYKVVAGHDMRSEMWGRLAEAMTRDEDGGLVPYKPLPHQVTAVMDALASCCNVPEDQPMPCWIRGDYGVVAQDCLPMRNGILLAGQNRVIPNTPDLFVPYSLPYSYTPGKAAPPTEWHRFLDSVWPGDTETQETLGEAIGYTLLPDHRHQVFFGLIGASRGGKGVINKIWRELLGPDNVVGPQLSVLGTQFGLEGLIGKPLCMIPDGRLDSKTNNAMLLERLLAITGGDAITVDRKHKPHWTGVLPTRIVLTSNRLPNFADGSMALANRFILFHFHKSFVGQEDKDLAGRLMKELPGILAWALECRSRLVARGTFIQPDSGKDLLWAFRSSLSPETLFVEDCCELGPWRTTVADLYAAWKVWSAEQGNPHTVAINTFARGLHAAYPHLKTVRGTQQGRPSRLRELLGIRLAPGVAGADDFFE